MDNPEFAKDLLLNTIMKDSACYAMLRMLCFKIGKIMGAPLPHLASVPVLSYANGLKSL